MELKYMNKEGYSLVGASFEVHKELGGGLAEEVYQESLELELGLQSINYSSKKEMRLHYKSAPLKKIYIPDLIVFDAIIVEIKATRSLSYDHERQLLNYMRISQNAVGYLINFGPIQKLEWKRFILSEFIPIN
jgi:GxxExxY protein